MKKLIADLETNGLLADVTCIHSIVLRDADSGELFMSCADQPGYTPLADGVAAINNADLVVGHNWLAYDDQVLRKLRNDYDPKGRVYDTLVAARVIFPVERLKAADFKRQAEGSFPGNMIGRQSVESWGYRLGASKVGTDITDWSVWTKYMHERCESDTVVGWRLYQHLIAEEVDPRCIDLEHEVARIIAGVERAGFAFDTKKAEALRVELQRRHAELEAQLAGAFPPWEVRTPFTPKVNNKSRGYVKGVPTEKVTQIVFNPASRDHIADRLKAVRGWKPTEFTSTGKPVVDETTISKLPYPEARLIGEYLMVGKRLGQLCEGAEALMSRVADDGRIHGSINSNGANTGRMTHSRPNLAQVPSIRAAYGKQFRQLFVAGTGRTLVGADADALELRCLAGYMAAYDGGAYAKTVTSGTKEEGTDAHTLNAKALGLDPKETYDHGGQKKSGRDIAKLFLYAMVYGAGDAKLGETLGVTSSDAAARKAGKNAKANFMRNLPAYAKLVAAVQKTVKTRGYLRGLDGRRLYVRSEHAALNTLLQSAGAVIIKQAIVEFERKAKAAGLTPGVQYELVAVVHDEVQMACWPEVATSVGELFCAALRAVAEAFRFGCQIDGGFSVGENWAQTH